MEVIIPKGYIRLDRADGAIIFVNKDKIESVRMGRTENLTVMQVGGVEYEIKAPLDKVNLMLNDWFNVKYCS